MTQKRIKELAEFFFSSDNSDEVPLRIAVSHGRYSGFDLDKDGLIVLLEILNDSANLRQDLLAFRKACYA